MLAILGDICRAHCLSVQSDEKDVCSSLYIIISPSQANNLVVLRRAHVVLIVESVQKIFKNTNKVIILI